MKNQIKSSLVLFIAIIAGYLITSCQQEQEKPLGPNELYDQGLSLPEIAKRLNAIELPPPEKISEDGNVGARIEANTETIKFDDNCLNCCAFLYPEACSGSGRFDNPDNPFLTTLFNTYFYAIPSLGPNNGSPAAGTQPYYIFWLDMNVDHRLVSSAGYWTQYRMTANSKKIKFDLYSIRNEGDVPITLWFLKEDGSWWYYPSLTGPFNWNISDATGITEFQVRGTDGAVAQGYDYYLDDLVVKYVGEVN